MKISKLFLAISLITISFATHAQIGIGTNSPEATAQLDVSSTSKGFLPPRMTEVQKNAISNPATGLIIWCSDCGSNGELQVYNGSAWTNFSGAAPATTSTVNGSPTNVVAVAGPGKATITFDISATGNDFVYYVYTVTSYPDGITGGVPVFYPSQTNGTVTLSGLNNGVDYTFTVTLQSQSTTVSSKRSNSVTPNTVSQTWQASNLDVTTYRDGTPIPQVSNPSDWAGLTTGAWCYYNNDPANGAIYGKLYNWYAVVGIHDNDPNTPNKILAPTGYHIPNQQDWNNLADNFGGATVAGGKMKEVGTVHWASPNTNATNESGFTGLPGGMLYNGQFFNIEKVGNWWSSDAYNASYSKFRQLNFDSGVLINTNTANISGFSVRCIQD